MWSLKHKTEAELEVEALRARILQELTFAPEDMGDGVAYRNRSRPELGSLMFYEAPELYAFAVANYTIAHDFTLPFAHSARFMRLGNFWAGKTQTEMSGNIKINTASAFLCVEHDISGTQAWRQGQHFHGVEVLLYPGFFERYVFPLWPEAVRLEEFTENEVYHYLPDELLHILEHLTRLAAAGTLSRMHLEALLVSAVAVLTQCVRAPEGSLFARQTEPKVVPLGPRRTLRLSTADTSAIRMAHDILSSEFAAPPSLPELSKRVTLGEQKLKFGFAHIYHQSIRAYTNSVRMSRAATLLTTTDQTIEEIAREVGFYHSGNFTQMFKKTYELTPLAFRKSKNNATN